MFSPAASLSMFFRYFYGLDRQYFSVFFLLSCDSHTLNQFFYVPLARKNHPLARNVRSFMKFRIVNMSYYAIDIIYNIRVQGGAMDLCFVPMNHKKRFYEISQLVSIVSVFKY